MTNTFKNVVLVNTITEAAEVAFSGTRSRPIVAMAGDQMVVCCRHTARKHGWDIIGRLF